MAMTALYLDKLNAHMEKMLLERMPEGADVRFLTPTIGKKGELKDADVLINTTFQVTKEIIDSCPNLKLIQRTGIGVDMVDVAYAKEKNIPISVCRGFNSVSVAELAVADILALYRRIPFMDTHTKAGEWHTWTHRHESYELTGKTVGVVGAGNIGRNVIKRVKAFDTTVLYYDPFRLPEEKEQELGIQFRELDDLVKEADAVVMGGLPLNDQTRGMIGKAQIQSMKKTAILVDTAREQLVDLEALAEALLNGDITGAAIDSFEPLPLDNPIYRAKDTNLILTPHIGAATYDNYDRVYRLCAANLTHLMKGEPAEMTI